MPKKTSPERLKHQIKALLAQNSRLERENTIEAKQQIARNETVIYHLNNRLNRFVSVGEGWQNHLAR